MAQKLELENLIQIIYKFSEGISIGKLLGLVGDKYSRRTLQRNLNTLVSEQRIIRIGEGRSTVYRPISVEKASLGEWDIPLSKEGEKIRRIIERPLALRAPAVYQRSFLDKYCPNKTFYLSEVDRIELKMLGHQSMKDEIAGTFARTMFNRLLIDLSWNSSRLEGNTYSLLETERLLMHGEEADAKSSLEARMILNHKAAIEFLVDNANEITINPITIRNLHALLSDGLLGDPKACGSLRAIPIGIGGSTYIPLQIPQMIAECFLKILCIAQEIVNPFEQAFFLMVHLPYLQPFEDVNKRTSRLAANIPLIKANLSPISFVGVSDKMYVGGILGVYELNQVDALRDVFKWAYQQSVMRYGAFQHKIGEPERILARYRLQTKNLVQDVVLRRLNKQQASLFIQGWAKKNIPLQDRVRFVEIVETELLALHIGNIAIYKLKEKEFQLWQAFWN